MKRIKRIIGDIVQVPLGDGTHTYGRVLPEASFAFYDTRTTEDLMVEQVVKRPILFVVAVMDHAVKRGRWPIVGHIRSEDGLISPPKFIQDPQNKNIFSIYENGLIRPSTREECIGLECAAVWEPEEVEGRLRDHYAGRKNQIFELLKIRD